MSESKSVIASPDLSLANTNPPSTPQWVSILDRLPPFDIPILLWGDSLDNRYDYPLSGRLCGCHELFLIEDYNSGFDDGMRDWSIFSWYDPIVKLWRWINRVKNEDDEQEYTHRMLGNVTHWLDWSPAPRNKNSGYDCAMILEEYAYEQQQANNQIEDRL